MSLLIWIRLLGVVFLGSGILFLGLGLRQRQAALRLMRKGIRVTGRVIRLDDTTSDGDSFCTWAPVVRFRAGNGRSYEARLGPSSDRERWRVGRDVPIFYEKGKPENATDRPRVWPANMWCVVSLLPILAGMMMLVAKVVPATPARAARAVSPAASPR